MKKRMLSLFLSLVLCLSLLPAAALADEQDSGAAGTAAIQLGTGGLRSPTAAETDTGTDYEPNSYVYFGEIGETPIKWRVLDADKTSDDNVGVFLLSERVLGRNVPFRSDGSSNKWDGSAAQIWCGFFASAADPANTAFSEAENAVIRATYKEETGTAFGVRFSASKLNGDKVFFLSGREAERYLGSYDRAPQLLALDVDDKAADWWLRSPYPGDQEGDVQAGFIQADGVVRADTVKQGHGARPALNLDAEKVLFISPAEPDSGLGYGTVGTYTGSAWKLTLTDNAHSTFTAKTTGTNEAGLYISYENAQTGKNEYLSVLVTDAQDSVTWYSRLPLSEGRDSGPQFISLSDVPDGFNKDTDKIYVFNEQDNGAYKTNYASSLVELSLKPESGGDVSITSITAIGNGSGRWLNGASYDPADDSNHMVETSVGSKIYEITYTGVAASGDEDYQVAFIANDSWGYKWGAEQDAENVPLSGDAVCNDGNIPFTVETDNSTVKLVLDLSKFNFKTEQGATYSITITPPGGGTEEPSVAEVITRDGETTGYPTLKAAFAAAADGSTVRLPEDVTEASATELSAGDFTFDLNGHKAPDCTLTLQSGAGLTITDSSADKTGSFGDVTKNGSGTLTLSGAAVGKITAESETARIELKAGSSFTAYALPSGMVLSDLLETGLCVFDGEYVVSALDQSGNAKSGKFTVVQVPADIITEGEKRGVIAYGNNGELPENMRPKVALYNAPLNEGVDALNYSWTCVVDRETYVLSNGTYSLNGLMYFPGITDSEIWEHVYAGDTLDVTCTISAKISNDNHIAWSVTLTGYQLTVKKNLSGVTVTVSNADSLFFTPDANGAGQPQTLEFTVTDNGTQLTEGEDYNILESSNQRTDAGEYLLALEGIGDYVGRMLYDWTVKPCELNSFYPIKVYDGTTDLPDDIYFLYSVPVMGGVILSKKDDKDFTATGGFGDPNVGDWSVDVEITLKNKNYTFEGGAKTKRFTFEEGSIKLADPPEAPQPVTITVYNKREAVYTYDVSQLLPELDGGRSYGTTTYSAWWNLDSTYVPEDPDNKPTIDGNGVLRLPINAVDSDTENQEVAYFKITVQPTNYYSFDLQIYVKACNPLTPTTVAPTLSKETLTYGDKLSDITLSGAMAGENNEEVEGTFAWVNPNETPDAGETVFVTWKFTPTDPKYAEVTGTATITVNPAQLTGVEVDQQDELTYNGTAQQASVSASATAVNDQPVTFTYCDTQDGDYSETVPAFTNAGEHTVYYKATAPNHEEATGSFKVTIKPKTIADPVIELAPGSFVYNGSAHEPAVTVKDEDTVIDPNSYTVVYANNINAGENTATVTIKSKDGGNYIISGSKEFTIEKAAAPSLTSYTISQKYTVTTQQTVSLADALASINMPTDAGTLTYTKGTADTGLSSITVNWAVDAASGDVTYMLTDGQANDQVTLHVTISSANYADTTANIVIKLIDRDTPTVSAWRIDAIYTGGSISAQAIRGTVTFNGADVPGTWRWGEQNADYTDVSDSGEKTVVFVPDDQVNFNPAQTKLLLVIAPAKLTAVSVWQSESLTYNGTAQQASVETKAKAVNEQPVTFTYCDTQDGTYSETVPAFINAGEYTVYFKATAPNHEEATGSFKVTIQKADPVCTAPTGVSAVYGQTLSKITLTNPDGNTPGTWTWEDGTKSVGDAGKHPFNAKFTPHDEVNYNSRENISVSVTVGKAQPTVSAAPAAKDLVYTGEAQALIEPGTTADGTMMYSLNKDGDYSETIPTGTGAGKYVVWYKIIGDDNHMDSDPASVEVTIAAAQLTVTVTDKRAYVYGAAPDLSKPILNRDYTVSGLIGSDTLTTAPTLTYDPVNPDLNKIGEAAAIKASGASAGGNYEITYVYGKLTVIARPSSGGSAFTYPITVKDSENGRAASSRDRAGAGEIVTVTVTPDKGYTLETLTVTDKDGNELTLTDKGGGKYAFTMPASSVTVTATFMDDNTMLNFFVDVKTGDYFYDAVLWAAQNGITTGTDAVHFSPNQPCTRAQIVTFLWRAAGSPVVNYAMNMTDVPGDAYYAEAVRWALSEGVTTGTTATTFGPNETCTRAQAVTFLCRSQKAAAEGGMAVREFTDFSSIPAYAVDAIQWALENHVTTGAGDGSFAPNAACTRAQIVTFLYRLHLSRQDAGR